VSFEEGGGCEAISVKEVGIERSIMQNLVTSIVLHNLSYQTSLTATK
jgi:hypothetical protein